MKTKLGIDQQTKKVILINDKIRRSGMYILGVQGQGKSLLLADLIYQDAKKEYAVIVIDPHGDLIRHLIAILPEERLEQTYLLDLADTEYPFSLNLFSCSNPADEIERVVTLDRVMHTFAKVWPETNGILLEKLLRFVTLTILEHPGFTLIDIRRLLWDNTFRASIVNNLSNEEVRAYWEIEYNSMSLGEKRREIQALDNRLAALRAIPLIKNIVGQRKTTIDFQRAIVEHEILLIHLPQRLKIFADLIGTILLTQIHASTFAFGELPWDQRPGFSLYIDEFQHYATSDFADLLKEGRKFGVRITIAHQDRQDLLPENLSATLTASTIISFRPTPKDATELAPLLLDTSAYIGPEHIFADPLRRLRLHENQKVQDFFRQHVLPLQQKNHNLRRGQGVLEALHDLIYQSIKTGTLNKRLFEEFLQRMFPILKLTFMEPQRKQQHMQEQLLKREIYIENLRLCLINEYALQRYLVAYHSHYSLYAYYHREEWYYQQSVPEQLLFTDTKFWDSLWSKTHFTNEPFEMFMKRIEEQATANSVLEGRDTIEKLISEEKRRLILRWKKIFQQIWDDIIAIHELESKYATNEAVRAYHAKIYHRSLQTPLLRKSSPIFLYPAASKIKNGGISEQTRLDDLVIRTLPFEADMYREAAKWLPGSDGHYYYPFGVREEEEIQAFSTFERIWQDVIWEYAELGRIGHLLEDETELLKNYYAEKAYILSEKHIWERLNKGNIDTNVWDELHREVHRNAFLSSKMNTAEKLIQMRVNELRKKIELLIEEREAYKVNLLPLEREIEKDFATIEAKRSAFRDYARQVVQNLIDDPGPLVDQKTPRESNIKAQLLNLGKREALVRVSSDSGQRPQICIMKTTDVPQGVKQDEVERRYQQIRAQTRAKYCQHQSKVEQEFRDESVRDEERPGFWYEE